MSASRPLRILITGGARGIGRSLSRHFLSAGHRVYIIDVDGEELDHITSLAHTWSPPESTASYAIAKRDLSDRSAIKDLVKDVSMTFQGKLDVLINNAFATPHSWSQLRVMEDPSDEIMAEWDTKIAVGLTAPFLLSRLCVPLLSEGETAPGSAGTIINISSTRAYQSELNHEGYSAAKAGLLGLTQSMAVSLGDRHKIRANAIVPGWIHVLNENKDADTRRRNWEAGVNEEDMKWHPAGRVGMGDDIAKAVEYLIDSGFVTGQEIIVDGGVGRKMVYPE